MIKLAVLTLFIALLAGVLGFPGVSEFALALSKGIFGVVGLVLITAGLIAFFVYRKFREELKLFRGK